MFARFYGMILGVALAGALLPASVQAFPEMIRHGYSRCTVCHVTSDGGGVLTPYGRALSKEVLSTWGEESESNFAYGAVTLPEWLQLGGDFRLAQTHIDTPLIKAGRTILMQADFEAAVFYDKLKFVGTLGYQTEVLSRRHYLGYTVNDDFQVRAGRFRTAFGLSTADHIIETERGLGFDQGTETYNIELAHWFEDFEIFLTGQFGRIDEPALADEQAVVLRVAQAFSETYKVGLSYYYGSRKGLNNRHLFGPYAMLGFTPHLFLLFELDFQRLMPRSGAFTWGAAYYTRFDYEFYRGLHVFVSHEYTKLDFNSLGTQKTLYTGGIQFFPRPHIELLFSYQRQFLKSSGSSNDYLYGMLHLYL